MSANWLRLLGLTMVSSWLLAGCSSPKKIEVGGICILNSDCNSPLLCTDGKCHDACHASVDCPTGQNCVKTNNTTVCQLPAEADCSRTACSSAYVCASDLRCRTVCQSAADCADGQECVTNVCADPNELDKNTGQLPQKAPGSAADGGTDAQTTATGGTRGESGSGGASGSSGGAGDAGPLTPPVADGGADAQASDGGGKDSSLGAGGAVGTDGPNSSGGATSTGSSGPASAGAIWYVNRAASSGGDGKSWSTAFGDLQSALTSAQLRPGDQIWVAQGTYTPAASGGSRSSYFYLATGVALYGGFHGTEAKLGDRDNPVDQTLTVLSGDLNGDDGLDTSGKPTKRTENTYHVVVGASNATLDGFTITGGNANSSTTGEQQNGGGMYNQSCDGLKLSNVTLAWNIATSSGGGLYNAPSSYTTQKLTNVLFARNSASVNGGGLCNSNGNATLRTVTFAQNTAIAGGGMYSAGNPRLTGVIFANNVGGSSGGGGLYNNGGSPALTNVIFSDNAVSMADIYSHIYGGGMLNNGGNPTLVNVTFSSNTSSNTQGDATSNASGGGISNNSGSPTLTNVTFSNNAAIAAYASATASGGAIYNGGTLKLSNSISWGNYVRSSVGEVSGSGITFSNSNVRGCENPADGGTAWNTSCGTDSGGNIDTGSASPFATYPLPSGSWSAAPTYSAKTYQTTFANTSAPWAAGELAGMFIQPDVNKTQWLLIVDNTATTLTVWGDMTSAAANGAMYQIHNLRLASGSQCTDSGDNSVLPADTDDLDADGNTTETLPLDLDRKARVVSGTVDMGAYEYQ
jgi:hypothetical protein